jgi:hypothetical protein
MLQDIRRRRLLVGWTTNAMARDVNGQSVHPKEAPVTCYCIFGAWHVESRFTTMSVADVAWSALERATLRICPDAGDSPIKYNDVYAKTKEDVLYLVDTAIEILRTDMH